MLNHLSEFSVHFVWGDNSIWGVATHLRQHASLRVNCMEIDRLNHGHPYIYKCSPSGDLLVQTINFLGDIDKHAWCCTKGWCQKRQQYKNREITGSFVKLRKNIQKMQQNILEDDKFSCWPACFMDCSAAIVFAIVTTWSVVWVNSVPISGAVTWSWNISVAGLKKLDSPYLTQSGLCTTHIKLSLVCQYPALYSVIIKVSCHIAYSLQLLSLVIGSKEASQAKIKIMTNIYFIWLTLWLTTLARIVDAPYQERYDQ